MEKPELKRCNLVLSGNLRFIAGHRMNETDINNLINKSSFLWSVDEVKETRYLFTKLELDKGFFAVRLTNNGKLMIYSNLDDSDIEEYYNKVVGEFMKYCRRLFESN